MLLHKSQVTRSGAIMIGRARVGPSCKQDRHAHVVPLLHCHEIWRLAIIAPNVDARAALEELSKHVGMVAHGGIGEGRQARVILVVYVCDVESLAKIAYHSTVPATSSCYERTES